MIHQSTCAAAARAAVLHPLLLLVAGLIVLARRIGTASTRSLDCARSPEPGPRRARGPRRGLLRRADRRVRRAGVARRRPAGGLGRLPRGRRHPLSRRRLPPVRAQARTSAGRSSASRSRPTPSACTTTPVALGEARGDLPDRRARRLDGHGLGRAATRTPTSTGSRTGSTRTPRAAASGRPRRYEVLNFAVAAYSPLQRLETLRRKVLAFHPDLVIYSATTLDVRLMEIHLCDLLRQGVDLKYDFVRQAVAAPASSPTTCGSTRDGKLIHKHRLKAEAAALLLGALRPDPRPIAGGLPLGGRAAGDGDHPPGRHGGCTRRPGRAGGAARRRWPPTTPSRSSTCRTPSTRTTRRSSRSPPGTIIPTRWATGGCSWRWRARLPRTRPLAPLLFPGGPSPPGQTDPRAEGAAAGAGGHS